ncbi:MAG TPA: hypothetical protein VNU97_11845 [Rhizomicrobium sp.]|jgi:hypothetical protein|nr:hypothetical protein [Rhizomicrobium sp.]
MPYRQRLAAQLTPYAAAPARIGHNGGPTLDLSWEAWLWRQAHAAAWKPPRRDIALHRLKRAERLGLDYRSYAGVLMNRGTHLGAAIFLLDGLSASELGAASERIVAICDCRILVGLADARDADAALLARADAVVAGNDSRVLVRAIDRFILAHHLTPGGTFLVGSAAAHLRAAEDVGLALFLWAHNYFGRAAS